MIVYPEIHKVQCVKSGYDVLCVDALEREKDMYYSRALPCYISTKHIAGKKYLTFSLVVARARDSPFVIAVMD